MTELMELLYDYVREFCFCRHIDQQDCQQLKELKEHNLSSLRRSLSATQTEALENYQRACYSQQQLELEAMFRAGFEVALKLHTL